MLPRLSLWLLVLTFSTTVWAFEDAETPMQDVLNAVRDYVDRALPGRDGEIHVQLAAPAQLEEWILPGDQLEVRSARQGRLLGRTLFLVTAQGESSQTPRYRWLTADVELVKPVVVAARPLERHQVIEPDDLAVQPVRITDAGTRYARSPQALVGKRVARSVARGTALPQSLVEEVPVIRRGDRVSLIVENGALRITALGQAKEDGYLGRPVAVLNLSSKTVVYGEAVDASTVRVWVAR